MQIKCDESLPRSAIEQFKRAGIDTHSVHDEGLNGSDDPSIAKACAAEGRVLVTLDLGFGDVRRFPPSLYAGIVVLRPSANGRRHVAALIQRVMPRLMSESFAGKLWIVSESSIRIRGYLGLGEEPRLQSSQAYRRSPYSPFRRNALSSSSWLNPAGVWPSAA